MHKYTSGIVLDPVAGEQIRRIIYQQRIMPRVSEITDIVHHFHNVSLGDGARKLEAAIARHYVGKFTQCKLKVVQQASIYCKHIGQVAFMCIKSAL